MSTGDKYRRSIRSVAKSSDAVTGDVYCILEAFAVTCPARAHAVKKLLCAGDRGKGGTLQDLIEARDAIDRAITLQWQRNNRMAVYQTQDADGSRKKLPVIHTIDPVDEF